MTLSPRPYAVTYRQNPDQNTLRELTLAHTPCVQRAKVGNLNKITRNKARMAKYTYVLAPDADAARYSGKTMPREQAQPYLDRQRAYIETKGELIAIEGYLGLKPRAFGVEWLYTVEAANIAAMQQILSFPRETVEDDATRSKPFAPTFRVVYTPDCFPEGLPGNQAIFVDLENWTTYILGPDYFGESKKGALRMLNEYVYRQDGLVLHAGAKEVVLGGTRATVTVMGLSGTGKTTTTFSKQGDITRPAQDDMVCLWPNGELSVTENGCFAKTFGLTEETEPVIYRGTLASEAWVENGFLDASGEYEFSKSVLSPEEVARYREILISTGADASNVEAYIAGRTTAADVVDEHGITKDGWDFVAWTENGRSIIPLAKIDDAADLTDLPPVRSMGILNRDEGSDAAMPGIVRFTSPEQAAGYFMLGETSKTSAAGKDRGKTRSPFTQPFFPAPFGLQAKRFSSLAATMPGIALWLMNTGYVGGDARDVAANKALKIKIRHSSAMLEALLSGSVTWTRDPDFGYEVVDVDAPENAALLEKVPAAILQPARYFAEQGREPEYRTWVETLHREREAFLRKYEVDDAIVAAVCHPAAATPA